MSDLETANTALRDDSDAQEQYSRRNCLLVHGIPEGQTDPTDAVLSLCNSQLGITSTWTIDGRIVCLLSNGRKETVQTVQTDSDLASVQQHCRR